MSAERMVVVDGIPARVVFDLLNAPRAEIDAYLAGRVDGFVEGEAVGFARGYATCDEELSRLQRAAHRNVQAMARLEPHADREERRRARQVVAAESLARQGRPLPDETAPIRQPRGDRTGCAGQCRRPGGQGHEVCAQQARGWPLEVVLTPAEAAYAEEVAS